MPATPWTAIGIAVTAFLALLTYIWSVSRHASEDYAALRQKISDGDQRLHNRMDKVVTDLGTYQTEVARTYVTREETNRRLEQIDGKLDRLIERNVRGTP